MLEGSSGAGSDPGRAAGGRLLAPSSCTAWSCCPEIGSFYEPIKEGFYHLFQLISVVCNGFGKQVIAAIALHV